MTMTPTPPNRKHIVAFEVSKATLVVQSSPRTRPTEISNRATAVRRLLEQEIARNARDELGAMLVICEATGGYERHVLEVATELGLACHKAHGSAVRNYARYRRKLAKNDTIDVGMLMDYASQTEDLHLYCPPRPEQESLRQLYARRKELQAMRHAEVCHLEHVTDKRVLKSLSRHIKQLDKEFVELEAEIAGLIETDETFRHNEELMRSVKGIGPVTAAVLLAYMPELGQIKRTRAAALAGVAPFDRDSCKTKGKRHIFGGRYEIRECLYMASLAAIQSNSVIRPFAHQLTARGKPSKVVITAVMRKLITILNAIIRDQEPWKYAKTA